MSATPWPEADLQSYGRCSHNENGHEEIDAQYHRTFWQWVFRKPATRMVWYRKGDYWYNKATDRLATDEDCALIALICCQLNRIKWS